MNPLEWLYFRAMQKRRAQNLARRAQETAPCPLLSIGNLTTGGTGKTPATQWAARFLQEKGRKIAVVSRGYGGSLSKTGAVVSDGKTTFLTAEQAGDEPILHARNLPEVAVVIGQNRHKAAQIAVEECGAQIVVLDDAFQFWSLPRAFDLVLLDAKKPFGNGHLLPSGRLREEPAALNRADAILLTRADRATSQELEKSRREIGNWTNAPIFEAVHAPLQLWDENQKTGLPLEQLVGQKIDVVSALANNDEFIETLEKLGAKIGRRLLRRDHHLWKGAEIGPFMRQETDAIAVVTSEKDAVKLQPFWMFTEKPPLWSLRIELQIENEAELQNLIREKLSAS